MDVHSKQVDDLVSKVKTSQVPEELGSQLLDKLERLKGLTDSPSFLPEVDRLARYIGWVVSIPWQNRTEDNLDLEKAKAVLDSTHYGLTEIKGKILEYMSVMKLNKQRDNEKAMLRAPILCFVGLVGTGKTTIAKSIADAMGRKYARIPFGGMGSPLDLRGQSRMQPESEPGKIIKALRTTGSINPVILLDEIDRVTDEGRASIMGVLVELLDPEQNSAFVDHYVDYPVNLSEVLFIATANNTHSIATAVLDRIEPIRLPSYTDEEKITIAKEYMLPDILERSGMDANNFKVEDDVWASIVRPLGFDAGMRTMDRTINTMVRRAAKKMVEGKQTSFTINAENVKEFLPKQRF